MKCFFYLRVRQRFEQTKMSQPWLLSGKFSFDFVKIIRILLFITFSTPLVSCFSCIRKFYRILHSLRLSEIWAKNILINPSIWLLKLLNVVFLYLILIFRTPYFSSIRAAIFFLYSSRHIFPLFKPQIFPIFKKNHWNMVSLYYLNLIMIEGAVA